MAAIMNLPSSPKVSAPADKPQQAQNVDNQQGEGFSQALSQQIEKKQTASEKPADDADRQASVDNSLKNQSVNSASESADGQKSVTEPSPSETDAASTEPPVEQISLPVETAVVQIQQPNLRELLGLGLGQEKVEDGKELPLMARFVESTASGASIAKVLAARTSSATQTDAKVSLAVTSQVPVDVQSTINARAAVDAQSPDMDERAQLAILQRAQQQLTQYPADGSVDGTPEGLKQALHGVENALQSLSRTKGDHAELKGLEQVREQLITRLQALQGQNAQSGGGNANSGEQQANSSRLPFLQTMNTEEGGKLSELSKLTRVAFQEMLAQQQASSGQAQTSVVGTVPAGPSMSMSSLSAMLSPASAANPLLNYAPSSSSLNVPVNHPAWGQAVGERLQWMVKQDIQQAEIKLNPRSMGPIEIKIAMNQDQATVSFVANHAMTREALDAAVPRLREMFGESGLNLVDVNVSQNPDTSGQRASEKGEEAGYGHSTLSDADTAENDQAEDERYITPTGNEQWYSSNSVLDAYA